MSINPVEIPTGAVRYNTDSNKMEVYIGSTWMEVAVSSPNLDGGARGIFTGGATPSAVNTIDFVTISTAGDATDFGDLSTVLRAHASFADRTRGLNAAGGNPSVTNTIEFITISSTGNSQNFGDLTVARDYLAGINNATRGVAGGAWGPSRSDVIDFVTMQSTGNAVDFGNLLTAKQTDGSFFVTNSWFLGWWCFW